VIVAIGASAGGVQALQTMFSAIPQHTGAAFVVIVHLDPERRSELPSILATRTHMPVIQVGSNTKLEPNHVYVIPPDRGLQLIDHEISATGFTEPRGQRSPIDQFFRSLADRLGDGFAVILSGAGSDGAIGVRAVKEAGGIILVQDPNEAEYASMPRSAIATGVADFVLPVREVARRLADLVEIKRAKATPGLGQLDEELLRRVLAYLRVRTGHDFSKYKRSTVLRRIARRIQVTRTDELKDYYDFLRENPDEAQALLGDLLISVTTFFRDAEAFEALSRDVVPSLFRDKNPSEPVRVWACGCATGEEATRSRSCCSRRRRSTRSGRRSRSSDPTSIPGRWPRRAMAAFRRRSRATSARNACGASSSRKATTIACGRKCATSCCSRCTTSLRIRRSRIST
jgi:two-component system CheB/CheR fusion protein